MDHVDVYDALHITPPIPEAEIAPLIANGTYVRIENDDPRGEPGYLARRPDAVMGVFVCADYASDDPDAKAAGTIESDWHIEFTEKDRTSADIAAEVNQLLTDFRDAKDGQVRSFGNVVAYEANTYLGPPHKYESATEVIVIREGRAVTLPEDEWRASIA
ncbi:hypothetical protein [Glycomyces sp. NPDC048151]|uniref:hypothetical protein n=1 Tax=Glycomyces sp. NPDC048151 TaxID=3364002 RepID=UPI0037198FE9